MNCATCPTGTELTVTPRVVYPSTSGASIIVVTTCFAISLETCLLHFPRLSDQAGSVIGSGSSASRGGSMSSIGGTSSRCGASPNAGSGRMTSIGGPSSRCKASTASPPGAGRCTLSSLASRSCGARALMASSSSSSPTSGSGSMRKGLKMSMFTAS